MRLVLSSDIVVALGQTDPAQENLNDPQDPSQPYFILSQGKHLGKAPPRKHKDNSCNNVSNKGGGKTHISPHQTA